MTPSNTEWTQVGGNAPASIIIQNSGHVRLLLALAAVKPADAKTINAASPGDEIECLILYPSSGGGGQPLKLEPEGLNVYVKAYGSTAGDGNSRLSFIQA